MTFAQFSGYLKQLEETASRIDMTKLLAELFRKSSGDEIDKICYLTQGRVVPIYEALEFGMADKLVIRAIAIATTVGQAHVLEEFKKSGDLGKTAEILKINNLKLRINNSTSVKLKEIKSLTVSEVYDELYNIAFQSGAGSQDQKITKLAELFSAVDALSARYIARIPLDKLRLGFSETTILDALSWMINDDKSLRAEFEDAYNVRPDIGYIAREVKLHGKQGLNHIKAKVGAPILAALCQRIPTADEMIEKMGKVAVEPKYDGMRVQIHYWKKVRQEDSKTARQNTEVTVKSFSRNLEDTTIMFPELLDLGKQIRGESVILDSEVVGVDPKTGKIMPFQETTTRKRKHQVDLFSQDFPVKFYVFDILFKDGVDLLPEPLSKRRKILEETIKKGEILEISPQIVTDIASRLRDFHDDQLKKGLEGAVVKKWESPYTPGRRNFSWVKFKEEEGKTGKLTDTIDAVIMGYYRGEGKRSDFGIGAFLVGVRKNDTFVTISKIGTGVTDSLWHELFTRLEKLKTEIKPKEYADVNKIFDPDVWISPELVVEIAGDDLTKSPNHGAGIAIRFPRLVKIRDDKSPDQATSIGEIEKMFDSQKNR
jgi:DNA ligase 1